MQVCSVDVGGVARGLGLEGQVAVSISHAIDMDFTLSFHAGVKVRCSLPPLPHLQHPISKDCTDTMLELSLTSPLLFPS